MTVVLCDSIQAKPLPIANAIIHTRLTRLVTAFWNQEIYSVSSQLALIWRDCGFCQSLGPPNVFHRRIPAFPLPVEICRVCLYVLTDAMELLASLVSTKYVLASAHSLNGSWLFRSKVHKIAKPVCSSPISSVDIRHRPNRQNPTHLAGSQRMPPGMTANRDAYS